MIYQVNYDSEDQLINLHQDIAKRVSQLKNLKKKGYTHVKDYWMSLYTGEELTPIDTYIIENESYLDE